MTGFLRCLVRSPEILFQHESVGSKRASAPDSLIHRLSLYHIRKSDLSCVCDIFQSILCGVLHLQQATVACIHGIFSTKIPCRKMEKSRDSMLVFIDGFWRKHNTKSIAVPIDTQFSFIALTLNASRSVSICAVTQSTTALFLTEKLLVMIIALMTDEKSHNYDG